MSSLPRLLSSSLPRLPSPSPLMRLLDPLVPMPIKRRLVEPLLNRAFADPLSEGEFDGVEGRRISLAVEDWGVTITLGLENQRLMLCDGPGEATIRGGWREFLCLATRSEDPDSLFFQRRLSIEGDTELGLMVKNLMDGQEAGVASGPLGTWLRRLDALANRAG